MSDNVIDNEDNMEARIRLLRDEAAAAGDTDQVRLCTAALGEGYQVGAYRISPGLRESVSSVETLGEADSHVYATKEEAKEEAEHLRNTWDRSWGMGACPTYEVESQDGRDEDAWDACVDVIEEAAAERAYEQAGSEEP